MWNVFPEDEEILKGYSAFRVRLIFKVKWYVHKWLVMLHTGQVAVFFFCFTFFVTVGPFWCYYSKCTAAAQEQDRYAAPVQLFGRLGLYGVVCAPCTFFLSVSSFSLPSLLFLSRENNLFMSSIVLLNMMESPSKLSPSFSVHVCNLSYHPWAVITEVRNLTLICPSSLNDPSLCFVTSTFVIVSLLTIITEKHATFWDSIHSIK